MIVQPTPTNPRSPIRRLLRIVGLVVPVVLLVVVVGAGLLGPRPEPLPVETAADTTTPAATAPLVAVAVPSDSPVSEPWGFRDPRTTEDQGAPGLPDGFGTLPAILPSQVVAEGLAGTLEQVVAVAGYLSMDGAEAACAEAPLGALGPWCPRHGVLADGSWSISPADGLSVIPPHVHVTVPVGVRLPDVVASMAVAARRAPVPVIAVGRLVGGPVCSPAWHECEAELTIDRITWADGERIGLTPLSEPRLQAPERQANPFESALDGSQVPLMAVLAWPRTIRYVDPAATDAAARADQAQPVWYVRVIDAEGRGPASHGGRPVVRWLLVDGRRLQVIATGTPAVPSDGPASRAQG